MYQSTTHIQRGSTRQALRAARLAPSLVVFSFLCLALTLAPRPASAFGNYGPVVDSYCLSYDGSTPYQDDGCLLCHQNNSGDGSQPGTWTWYRNQTYQYFCTGTAPNQAPNGTITAPLTNQQIAAGGTVRFESTGTDADGDTLSYSWNLGVATATGPGPHLVSFPSAGSYVVTLTVSDGQLSDPTPATRHITVTAATSCTDADGDGYLVSGAGCAPIDCDDNDPAINPGAIEDCSDGIDNNCNGLIDTADSLAIGCIGCLDSDGDLFSPEGGSCGPIDCDDTDATVNPGAVELCSDGIDNDCDFYLDGTDAECSGEDCIGELLAPPGIGLLIGDGPARADPQPLEGLTVRGSVFVFVDSRPEIVQASWSLDGEPVGISTEAPWDFAGSSGGHGNPFNTRTLANGWHSMFAEILLDSGQTQGFSAAFIVDNQVPNQAPTCTIDQPAQDQTIMAGDSLNFAGTGIETDGDLPLTFAWDFGGAASNKTVADPGTVRFDRGGSYTLSFTVTDSAGLPCISPATLGLTVRTTSAGDDEDDEEDEEEGRDHEDGDREHDDDDEEENRDHEDSDREDRDADSDHEDRNRDSDREDRKRDSDREDRKRDSDREDRKRDNDREDRKRRES